MMALRKKLRQEEYEMYIKGRLYSIKDNYMYNKNNKTINIPTVFGFIIFT